ncbi:hypothetical protein FIU82_05965 [Pseudoalteromonas sp. THAF3]|uniref:hypothetical protein n=1 Tax=Pseudoalteromonas sp. THAF3 TaxID=2587843 RepID=UPI0012691CBD|nr:hypothetical protein [Pseudoalteromonas sp. THAF3]QFU04561.1 hypothetical protein FIU82_05965 [Pseudoalteromonas sp. THAF3]
MIDAGKLRVGIIRPTLTQLSDSTGRYMAGRNVEDLLVMIAAHESHFGKYRRQVGGGPARGIYQIEIPTHDDLFENYLEFRPEYKDAVLSFTGNDPRLDWQLENNDRYATAAARLLLWRKPEAIPAPADFSKSPDPSGAYLLALAEYAKKHWNTEGGAATPEKYLEDYLRLT